MACAFALVLFSSLAPAAMAHATARKFEAAIDATVSSPYVSAQITTCKKAGQCLKASVLWDYADYDNSWLYESYSGSNPDYKGKKNGSTYIWDARDGEVSLYWREKGRSCFVPSRREVNPLFDVEPLPRYFIAEKSIGANRFQARSIKGVKPAAVLYFTVNDDDTLKEYRISYPKRKGFWEGTSFKFLTDSPRPTVSVPTCP